MKFSMLYQLGNCLYFQTKYTDIRTGEIGSLYYQDPSCNLIQLSPKIRLVIGTDLEEPEFINLYDNDKRVKFNWSSRQLEEVK